MTIIQKGVIQRISGGGGSSGTVTNVSVVTANGVSGSVATSTTTPAITLTLGAITPTSVNSVVLSGSSTPTLAVTGTTAVSGTNTGDQTSVSGNAGTATALQNARTIGGVSFNGTANITVASATGGFAVSGGNLTVTGDETITSSGANALAVGPNGTTNPTLQADASTASAATGLKVKSAAAAGGLAVSVISSGTDENMTLDAKGAGTITINGTATGGITLSRATTISGNTGVTGTITGTSASAVALAVGANGATNPVLAVDASTASVVGGIAVKGGATGGTTTITATDSGSNHGLTVQAKGSGVTALDCGSTGSTKLKVNTIDKVSCTSGTTTFTQSNRASTTAAFYAYNFGSGATLTASTEAHLVDVNMSTTQTHSTGALTLQRDYRIRNVTNAFSAASTLTDAATFAVDGAPIAGSNATQTNSSTIYSAGAAVGSGTTNSYGLNITANTGATNNYAAQFVGATVMNGAQLVKRTTVADAAYTALITDYLISYTTLTTGRTVTLPAPTAAQAGQEFVVKDEVGNAGTNNITLAPASGTIDGAANKVINTNYGSLRVYHNGTNYFTY